MAGWIKERDPSRMLHNEGAWETADFTGHTIDKDYVDVRSRMYFKIERMIKLAEDKADQRPLLYCEYAHAMGNSTGHLYKFADAFRKYPRLIGGFIWDWVDQGIWLPKADGGRYIAYGGDFGEKIHDGSFCLNGLVFADRRPQPALMECKYEFQPLAARLLQGDGHRLEIENRFNFRSLEAFDISWNLLENGSPIASGRLDTLFLKAGGLDTVLLQWPAIAPKAGAEYFLNLSVRQNMDFLWAKKDHEVASFQLPLAMTGASLPILASKGLKPLEVAETEDAIIVNGRGFSVHFDRKKGLIKDYIHKDKSLIFGTLRPNFWRAPIENDYGSKQDLQLAEWKQAGSVLKLKDFSYDTKTQGLVTLKVDAVLLGGKANYFLEYQVFGNGDIKVSWTFDPVVKDLPNLPRMGMQLEMPQPFGRMEWYGRGPWENYIDRNRSAFVGRYSQSVVDNHVDYPMPSENGYKTDVRWLAIKDLSGRGLLFVGNPLLGVNASPYTQVDLEAAKHASDLVIRNYYSIYIDWRQSGVGGDDTWSDRGRPHEEHRIYARKQQFSFRISPLEGKKGEMDRLLGYE